MNRQARRLSSVIGGALVATACAPAGVTSYAGREVAAPTEKMIEEAKTKADHEALAVYYDREARHCVKRPSITSGWPIKVGIGVVLTG